MKTIEKKTKENIHPKHRQRLRHIIYNSNFDNLTEVQILEYVLTLSIPRKDTNPIAHRLLDEFKTIANVFEADYSSLINIEGIGSETAKHIKALSKLFYYYRTSSTTKTVKPVLTTPKDFVDHFTPFLESKTVEEFYVACLTANSEVIKTILIGTGTQNSVDINMPVLISTLTTHKPNMVVIAHNHPNGIPTPSGPDYNATKKIFDLLSYMNIPLVDHIIISGSKYYSFKAEGALELVEQALRADNAHCSNKLFEMIALNKSKLSSDNNKWD